MQSLIEFARFWMLFVLGAVAMVGAVSLPYWVWTLGGPVVSGVAIMATAVSVWVIGKYGDRF